MKTENTHSALKKGTVPLIFKQLQIEIDDGELRLDDSDHKGVYIEIPSSCRECFSKEKESIKVAIKWDNEKEEVFT